MDWQNIIAEILSAGLSQTDIGVRINRSQVWVSDLSSGRYADVKWRDGQALLALHRDVCRDTGPTPDAPKAKEVA